MPARRRSRGAVPDETYGIIEQPGRRLAGTTGRDTGVALVVVSMRTGSRSRDPARRVPEAKWSRLRPCRRTSTSFLGARRSRVARRSGASGASTGGTRSRHAAAVVDEHRIQRRYGLIDRIDRQLQHDVDVLGCGHHECRRRGRVRPARRGGMSSPGHMCRRIGTARFASSICRVARRSASISKRNTIGTEPLARARRMRIARSVALGYASAS